jgi:nucleoside-diphosphate-sugar epimerase
MVRFVRDAGHDVTGLDTGFFEDCVLGEKPEDDTPIIRKDIRDVSREDLSAFDTIIHLAALSNDPLGDINPNLTYAINHQATTRLATLAKEAGVQRFLFGSTCSIYGAGTNDPATEDAPLAPLTPYAVSKARSEEDLRQLADDDFSPAMMRSATAYGASPFLRLDIVLNNLVGWAYTTGKVLIQSDGTPWRPVIHIEDISRAFIAVLEAPRELIHNQTFNVGSNAENYQIRYLAAVVQEVVPGCEIVYANRRNPDQRSYRVDFTKLSTTLDFTPTWTARRGAEELLMTYRAAQLTRQAFERHTFVRLEQLQHLIEKGELDNTLRWRNHS